MAKVQKKKFFNASNIIFISGIVAITIIIAVFVFIMCGPFTIKGYENMKQVNYSNYKTQEPHEYYVFVYSDEFEKSEWCEEIVIEYAELARTDDTRLPIYGYNYDAKENDKILSDLSLSQSNEDRVVRLIHISDGSIKIGYYNWDDIHNELVKAKTAKVEHNHS